MLYMSSAIIDNIVKIKADDGYSWEVLLSDVDNCLVFKDGWNRVVADLGLKAGSYLFFKHTDLYGFKLTPFLAESSFPMSFPEYIMLTSRPTDMHGKNVESFCHKCVPTSLKCLLLPKDYVKKTVGNCWNKGLFKVYLNHWDYMSVRIRKEDDEQYYLFDGWMQVASFMKIETNQVIVVKYPFKFALQLTVYDFQKCEQIRPKLRNVPVGADSQSEDDSDMEDSGDSEAEVVELDEFEVQNSDIEVIDLEDVGIEVDVEINDEGIQVDEGQSVVDEGHNIEHVGVEGHQVIAAAGVKPYVYTVPDNKRFS